MLCCNMDRRENAMLPHYLAQPDWRQAMDTRTAHALIRFGLGRRGSESVPADPLGWLLGQLDSGDPNAGLPVHTSAEELTAKREAARQKLPDGKPKPAQQMFLADAPVMARAVLNTPAPLRERLVWFWANHFTVSRRRGEITAVAIPYIQEAIRPHVTGTFADMLGAVMHHPAMLTYLDATESFGPNSLAGVKKSRGLNENLARECLELHTVSPAAGYTQADVTEFARVLTGWTVDANRPEPGFAFLRIRHEPGSKTVMGHTFPEGEDGGIAALDFLGHHPATYRHIATQLVQHFVADDPPPADVARVAAVLGRSGGDLKAATAEILHLPSAWTPLTKLRAPWEYAVAVLRALDLPDGQQPDLGQAMQALGQPFMSAPLPNGWGDTASVWGDGELLLRRADWAMQVAGRAQAADPVQLADAVLGPLLSATTRDTVRLAPSRRESLALLLASPEFQRR